jgi:tetratricopeptide (TPR) repeat protein
VASATVKVGSREAASELWVSEAEHHLNERNLDLAMRRYNQAWLLNPSNYKPYWGFGRVSLERDKFEESVQHMQKALELMRNPHQRPALLSDLGTAYSFWAASFPQTAKEERSRLFARANQSFQNAAGADPSYANTWRRWAVSLYREGDYAQAWVKVREARAKNAPAFTPQFIRSLESQMPEPK